MVGHPRVYAAAAVAVCLGALALSVAAAWSQAPPAPSGGVSAPPLAVTGGSGGAVASPEPDPAAVPALRPAEEPTADQAPVAAQVPTAAQATVAQQQPPSAQVPERQQELENEVPLEHFKPQAPQPAPPAQPAPPVPPPALAPVATLGEPLPVTGVEPGILALTGFALLAMGAALRGAADLRRA